MDTSPIFSAPAYFSAGWESGLFLAALVTGGACAGALARFNARRPADQYDPQRAWLRAGTYFAVCVIIGWATGVSQTLLSTPVARSDQIAKPLWGIATAVWFAVIFFGYAGLWRRGTVSYGRKRYWSAVLPFGLLWGASASQLLLSVWALAESAGAPRWAAALATYVAAAILNGAWHALYWDKKVSPDHNIREWNMRKVKFAHTPNLILSLAHLAMFANPWLFVAAQTLALSISTAVMRFPPFWGPESKPSPQHDGMGRTAAEIADWAAR